LSWPNMRLQLGQRVHLVNRAFFSMTVPRFAPTFEAMPVTFVLSCLVSLLLSCLVFIQVSLALSLVSVPFPGRCFTSDCARHPTSFGWMTKRSPWKSCIGAVSFMRRMCPPCRTWRLTIVRRPPFRESSTPNCWNLETTARGTFDPPRLGWNIPPPAPEARRFASSPFPSWKENRTSNVTLTLTLTLIPNPSASPDPNPYPTPNPNPNPNP
jgi:hypothetical protein